MNKYNTKRNGVGVRIIETGEEFNSIQACAKRLDVSANWLGSVIRDPYGYKTCRGYHIVLVSDTRTLEDFREARRVGRPGKRIRIIETGEVYDSITECANSMDGSAGTIHDALHKNRNKHTYKGKHFELID